MLQVRDLRPADSASPIATIALVMVSERVQRQVDALLDDVEAAARALDWPRVHELCDGVLRLDPENVDARTFLQAAQRDTGVNASPPPPPTDAERAPDVATPIAPPHPERFAGDR